MIRYNKQGFTLIELLVVISIIGLLSSIVWASLGEARMRARDARRFQDFQQFQTALELFYDKYGVYPCGRANARWDSSANDGSTFLNGSGNSTYCISEPYFGIYSLGVYPLRSPKDPLNSGGCYPGGTWGDACNIPGYYYGYMPSSDRKQYVLWTRLEADPDWGKSANDKGQCYRFYEVGPGVGKVPLFNDAGSMSWEWDKSLWGTECCKATPTTIPSGPSHYCFPPS